MHTTKACAATLAALTLSVPGIVRAQQETPAVKEPSAHERLREIRNAGLQGDRTKIPMLIANLEESKLGERSPGQAYAEWALQSLAQLGAVEALSEIEKYDNDKSTIRLHARVTRARLLAESEAKGITDQAARAQATLNRFLKELKLEAKQLNDSQAKIDAIKRRGSHGSWPLETLAVSELADMIYHKRDRALAQAAQQQGIDFEQYAPAAVTLRYALLSDKERLSTLIEALSNKKVIRDGEAQEIRLAIDHGLAASRAAGAKLQELKPKRAQYANAGLSALLQIIHSVGDKDQLAVVESFLNDKGLSGDATQIAGYLRKR